MTTYARIHTLPIYEQVEGMVVAPPNDERRDWLVATAGSKGIVRLWALREGKLEAVMDQAESDRFGGDRGGYMDLQFTRAAWEEGFVQEQLIVADAEHNITILSLANTSLLQRQRTIVGHNDEILDLKGIPSHHERIVVVTNSPQVRVFNTSNFACDVLDGHQATVLCVDVSPCGRFIATCGKDKTARIWHTSSRSCVAIATGHTEAVGSTALSRKVGRYEVTGKAAKNGGGAFLITVSVDRTMKKWCLPGAGVLEDAALDGVDPIEIPAFSSARAHEKDINIVSVAPNDSLIATGSQDKTIKLWSAVDLTLKGTLKGHRRGVWDCQFSPFDRVLASSSGDKSIKLWSLSDLSCVRTFQGHMSSVLRVRFISKGLQLLSSGSDGLLKVWTIRTNECETTLDGHVDKVWAVDVVADGRVVSGGADSRLVVWKDTTADVELEKQVADEEALLADQKLANHLRHDEFAEALEIALAREKPLQALKILVMIVEKASRERGDPMEEFRKHVLTWSDERLLQILQYSREWNTRSRNCYISLLMVKAVVKSIPIHKLVAIKGVPEILAGIVPYAERHFERIDKLHADSFILDFALHSMGYLESDTVKDHDNEFKKWEERSKPVLPSAAVDGRVQIGGATVVGTMTATSDEVMAEDVVTLGDSDSSDESDSGQDSGEDEKESD